MMRTAEGLTRALDEIERLRPSLATGLVGRNLGAIAAVITNAALNRTESRGGHHRLDHPETSPEWEHHTFVTPEPEPLTPLVTAVRGAA